MAGPHGLPEGVTPEDVLAYVYAVLHAPSYRSRYGEYLKSDFPRIPLPKVPIPIVKGSSPAMKFDEIWSALLPLGQELIALHLLKAVPPALRPGFALQGDNTVEKPRYEPPHTGANATERGRVWINAVQYFDGVPPETWAHKVGGYPVCEKWLKDRRGRALDFADIGHYADIVAALNRTRALMKTIDGVVDGVLWAEHTHS